MTSKPNRLAEAAELRRRAEDYAAQAGSSLPAPLEPEDTQRTLHELRVYQVELEMQNSELCRSRAGLEAAQARHFDFYNRAPVGYVSLSEAGLILEANLPFANLVGVAPGALVKEPLTRFVLKEDRDTLYFLGKRLAATGASQACDLRMVKGDGTLFWAQLRVAAAEDAEGKPVSRIVLSDITDRKHAEESLAAARQDFERFFNLVPELVVVASVDGHFKKLNPAWEHALGYTLEELRSAPFESFVHPDDVAATRAEVERQRQGGKTARFENRYRHKDGSWRWLEWNSTAAIGETLYATARDITERKQAEAALRHSLLEKEALLKEIHHRVKNNLQIVSSLLRLQSARIENPVAKDALQNMQDRVRSMGLIHEHLYQSHDPGAVAMSDYLKSLCRQLFYAQTAVPGTIQLHLELAPARLTIEQAIPCGLIVTELVCNALKHAFPEGRAGEVRVELQPVAGGAGLRLRVADDGVGLPAALSLERLTTLGLRLVPELSRQLGGRLEIHRTAGTVFDLIFNESARV